jgi:hypothetical protein
MFFRRCQSLEKNDAFAPSPDVAAGAGSRDCEPSRDEVVVEAAVLDWVEEPKKESDPDRSEEGVPDRIEEGVADRVDGVAEDDDADGGILFWLGTTIFH